MTQPHPDRTTDRRAHGALVPPLAPETLSTRRLTLLPLRVEHATEMAGVLADPGLYAFTGGEPPTPRSLRTRYERLAAGSPDPAVSWCNWAVELRGEGRLVGYVQATIGPSATAPTTRTAEIAWVVGTAWQGRGIATEAAGGLVNWLSRRSVRQVVAHIHPEHPASLAVAAAIGMADSGLWQGEEAKWRLTPSR